ncbi:MAG: STAS domain-containing protein [Nitrospira sp.]|nr:STAS domain-containing protein [Nitrospira sp.]
MTDPLLLAPSGDLTIFEISDFKTQLQAGLKQGQGITVDLGETGTVDASALQLLIAASLHESVQLINVPARVTERFVQMGWTRPKGQGLT